MVSIAKRGEAHSFSLPDERAEKLGLAKGARYELVKVKDGFFVLHETAAQKIEPDHDSRIFSLLKAKKLAERVEGKFESLLNSVEKTRLNELVKEGRIVRFKLSDRYKKAVYKTREEAESGISIPVQKKPAAERQGKPMAAGTNPIIVPAKKPAPAAPKPVQPAAAAPKPVQPAEKPGAVPEKPVPAKAMPVRSWAVEPKPAESTGAAESIEAQGHQGPKPAEILGVGESQEEKPAYSLERDHFTVVSNDEAARRLSQRLNQEIRRKEVLGTKSFSGDYFVIKTALYEKHSPAVLNLVKGKPEISADELAERLRMDKQLVMAICEFLREEGEITERRREVYRFVG